ncbi:MAG TPA: DUF4272 domain-containing protein [Acidimicrobiales bacterium]|nr:DUF4272 domain-containing protein [Acidimicrobiales bacterium]
MDTAAIRKRSLKEAARLGYEVSAELPLSDFDVKARDGDELVDRCLVLHALIAVSYGFPRDTAKAWLTQEELTSALSPSERRYLDAGDAAADEFFHGLSESVWALMWSLGLASKLDFAKTCPNDLVRTLPNLKTTESAAAFRARAQRRSTEELLESADLAYCLNWAITDAALRGASEPGRVPGWVVIERRRALEWVLSDEDWDEVPLDT